MREASRSRRRFFSSSPHREKRTRSPHLCSSHVCHLRSPSWGTEMIKSKQDQKGSCEFHRCRGEWRSPCRFAFSACCMLCDAMINHQQRAWAPSLKCDCRSHQMGYENPDFNGREFRRSCSNKNLREGVRHDAERLPSYT